MSDLCEIACVIGVAFNCDADTDELAEWFHESVDFVARRNVRWMLEQMEHPTPEAFGYPADAEWPPCCPGCADILHVPDPSGLVAGVEDVRRILTCGSASCGGAAAFGMAYEIAVLVHDEGLELADALERVHPRIAYGKSPDGGASGRYFHATFTKDGEIHDPTKEMRTA